MPDTSFLRRGASHLGVRGLAAFMAVLVLDGTGLRALGQVPDAVYSVTVGAGTGQNSSAGSSGPTPRNIAIDNPFHVFSPGDPNAGTEAYTIELEQRAHAEAYGGVSPQAIATAEARVTTSTNGGGQAAASASTTVTYFLHLNPQNANGLVWHPAQIPVEFHALGSVTGTASCTVSVANINTGLGAFSASASSFLDGPEHSFDRTVSFTVAPDQYLRVVLSAYAAASDSRQVGVQSAPSSQALADPTFIFDQPAFDIYAASEGQATFRLADFYELEFSPTVTPVPEPSNIAWGLVALAGLRRRR